MNLRLLPAVMLGALALSCPATSQAVDPIADPNFSGASYGAYGAVEGEVVYGAPVVPWHAGYAHVAWGKPLALVVPPTATHETNWGWGIGNTRITRLYPQYQGPVLGYPTAGGQAYRPLPYWPSDTRQFGVYYIRGPW